ncbi:MAG: hypothetical protein A2233_01395 [Candidatus Kerfeldbacteria bacterium RIFOXYA2_FULL_38_24]|uniref:Uncharacterized protein n=1 Tax=Candidatus Kerfeldbacteria bacterium RIFOXYB2_FULL_38_14 TaxID=1798547 RepID=A0A1G2BFR5_9BACT|nr:MAG: hypothetical protein A2233_01395 [Candidatus Kerfeldbacteria bacterium RIFOXYA2_FULL_38_24]OGY87389.1 MAG: hypothetical protein A2319_05485 [Candidatus Kerfeldbacteria bacterium RIFOXYB2_FULL_38_14]OGY90340.1 MAG: hypothetical protein A2458_04390 [Candidatus Kerfeldbacteria bacterium RIFOXYC2_FULL_38_9]
MKRNKKRIFLSIFVVIVATTSAFYIIHVLVGLLALVGFFSTIGPNTDTEIIALHQKHETEFFELVNMLNEDVAKGHDIRTIYEGFSKNDPLDEVIYLDDDGKYQHSLPHQSKDKAIISTERSKEYNRRMHALHVFRIDTAPLSIDLMSSNQRSYFFYVYSAGIIDEGELKSLLYSPVKVDMGKMLKADRLESLDHINFKPTQEYRAIKPLNDNWWIYYEFSQ